MLQTPVLYIDRDVADHQRVREISSQISFQKQVITSGESHPGGGILLTRNRGGFVKPCPGMKGSVCCGLWVVEWGLGCPFRCEYCVLQVYQPSGDMTLHVNWEDCLEEVSRLRHQVQGPIRLCTGEFGDSLALEEIFPLNSLLAKHTAGFPDFTLELKTKSICVDHLLDLADTRHLIVSFSLNAPWVMQHLEHGTATLHQRLDAARRLSERGIRLAFHFDPLVAVTDWETQYRHTVEAMYHALPQADIAWISLGTFRFPRFFPDRAREVFPDSMLFQEEFHPSFDGKLRYFRPLREKLYTHLFQLLGKAFPQTRVYLCMESQDVWERTTGQRHETRDLKGFLDQAVP